MKCKSLHGGNDLPSEVPDFSQVQLASLDNAQVRLERVAIRAFCILVYGYGNPHALAGLPNLAVGPTSFGSDAKGGTLRSTQCTADLRGRYPWTVSQCYFLFPGFRSMSHFPSFCFRRWGASLESNICQSDQIALH
jgi:hypothetical protein